MVGRAEERSAAAAAAVWPANRQRVRGDRKGFSCGNDLLFVWIYGFTINGA